MTLAIDRTLQTKSRFDAEFSTIHSFFDHSVASAGHSSSYHIILFFQYTHDCPPKLHKCRQAVNLSAVITVRHEQPSSTGFHVAFHVAWSRRCLKEIGVTH